jgi:RND family efflux transporter MFP subunit
MRNFIVILLIALVLAGVGVMLAKKAPKPPKPGPSAEEQAAAKGTSVSVTPVAVRPMEDTLEVTGTLQPYDEVQVGTRGAGRITMIIGKEGTPVAAGQLVARIDDEEAQTQVKAAEAAVEAAQARVEQAKAAVLQQSAATDSGISNAQAAVDAARARLQQAKAAYEAQDAGAAAQVRAAQAGLDAANSRLSLLKNGSRSQERDIAASNVKIAKNSYDLDRANYERYKQLYEKGAVSRAMLDTMETKMKVSEAQLQSAQQQLSLVQEGARQEDIQTAQAAVQQAQTALDTARANLKQVDVARANVEIAQTGVAQAQAGLKAALAGKQVDVMRDKDVLAAKAALSQAKQMQAAALQLWNNTFIYSPVAGVVSEKLAEVGQSLGANVAVLRIATNNALFFEAQVSELAATRLHAGQTVDITVDALQADRTNAYAKSAPRTVPGTIERVVPVVDAKTRNCSVRVVVARTGKLMPGMFARGAIVIANYPDALVVPKDALVEKAGQDVLFVVANGAAHVRPVTVGLTVDGEIQITSGVQAGDQIVTVGQQALKDGEKVVVKEELVK